MSPVTDRVHRLTLELTDASRFQDAYYKLLDETEGLLARNDLAEEEAERLSQFNAEILGHHNPAQRIVYVDRIRRELADTKQVRTAVIFRGRVLKVVTETARVHARTRYVGSVKRRFASRNRAVQVVGGANREQTTFAVHPGLPTTSD